MKRLLLSFLILFSTQSFCQNWRPYNPLDSVQHFVAEDSLDYGTIFRNRYVKPILTAAIESNNRNNTYTFFKGFSILKAKKNLANNLLIPQKIKAKVFGDSLTIYQDSSVFKSIDTFGYRLSFPHHYSLNQQWILCSSVNNLIKATVDSLFTDSVFNSIDSIALIQLQLMDSNSIPISSSLFNTKISISKNHGIINTIDFTDLDSVFHYNKIVWNTNNDVYITKQEMNALGVGDYYFNEIYDTFFGSNYSGWRIRKHEVILDTLISGIRTKRIVEHTSNSWGPPIYPPSGVLTYSTLPNKDTVTLNYLDNDTSLFKYSGCITDTATNINNSIFFQFGEVNLFGKKYITSINSGFFYYSQNGIGFGKTDSIIEDRFEFFGDDLHYIGLGVERDFTSTATGSQGTFQESIYFAQKGNNSWGIRPLVVGLSETKIEKDKIKFYPNPVTQTLFIESNSKDVNIQILNAEGRVVIKTTMGNQINVEKLPKGIYFLQIIQEDRIRKDIFIKN